MLNPLTLNATVDISMHEGLIKIQVLSPVVVLTYAKLNGDLWASSCNWPKGVAYAVFSVLYWFATFERPSEEIIGINYEIRRNNYVPCRNTWRTAIFGEISWSFWTTSSARQRYFLMTDNQGPFIETCPTLQRTLLVQCLGTSCC